MSLRVIRIAAQEHAPDLPPFPRTPAKITNAKRSAIFMAGHAGQPDRTVHHRQASVSQPSRLSRRRRNHTAASCSSPAPSAAPMHAPERSWAAPAAIWSSSRRWRIYALSALAFVGPRGIRVCTFWTVMAFVDQGCPQAPGQPRELADQSLTAVSSRALARALSPP